MSAIDYAADAAKHIETATKAAAAGRLESAMLELNFAQAKALLALTKPTRRNFSDTLLAGAASPASAPRHGNVSVDELGSRWPA